MHHISKAMEGLLSAIERTGIVPAIQPAVIIVHNPLEDLYGGGSSPIRVRGHVTLTATDGPHEPLR